MAVVAVSLAGCGTSSEEPVATAGAPTTGSVGLPTLPPVEERTPELFDDDGCVVAGPEAPDCSTTAEDIDVVAAGDGEGDERLLEGFLGTRWNDAPSGAGLVVLGDTVTITDDRSGWRAVGLARNESTSVLSGMVVRAVLIGGDGTEVGRAEAPSPVIGIRPGEPVPFTVATLPSAPVDSVRWELELEPDGGDGGGAERAWELGIYWTRPFGDPRSVSHYLYRDEGDARPHVLNGGVINRGSGTAAAPRVVAGFVAPSGRIVHVAVVDAVGPTGDPRSEIAPEGTADFLVAVPDGDVGPLLVDTTPMLWAVNP